MIRIATTLLLFFFPLGAFAGHLELIKINETVYQVVPAADDVAAQSNSVVILLPDGLLVFDTLSTPDLLRELLTLVATVSDLPLTRVVLSHAHLDHAGGLDALRGQSFSLYTAPGTPEAFNQAVATDLRLLQRIERSTAQRIRSGREPESEPELRKQLQIFRRKRIRLQSMPRLEADIVVESRLEIVAGDRRLVLLHGGPGHSGADLMLYLPDEKILLAGDLVFVQALPFMQDAVSAEWLKRLDETAALEVEMFLPGHGEAGSRTDRDKFRRFLVTLRTMVAPIAKNGTQLDLVNQLRLPPTFEAWGGAEDLWFPAALKVYQELKAGGP